MKQLPIYLAALAALIGPAAFGRAADATPPADSPAAESSAPTASHGAASGADSSSDAQHTAQLEAQLEAARRRLEEAARQVAELSARMGQPLIQRFDRVIRTRGGAYFGIHIDFSGAPGGVRVLDVIPGGAAAQAGIRAGDVITSANGTGLRGSDGPSRLLDMARNAKPGSKVRIQVRRDGKTRMFTVTAQPRPDVAYFARGFAPPLPLPPMPAGGPTLRAFPFGGALAAKPLFLMRGPLADMELATLSPSLGSYFGTQKGVLVVRAPAGGALKLEDGDVILSIGGREPLSGPHATRILATYQPGEKITLEILRHHKVETIETKLPQSAPGGHDVGNEIQGGEVFHSAPADVPRVRGRILVQRDDTTT